MLRALLRKSQVRAYTRHGDHGQVIPVGQYSNKVVARPRTAAPKPHAPARAAAARPAAPAAKPILSLRAKPKLKAGDPHPLGYAPADKKSVDELNARGHGKKVSMGVWGLEVNHEDSPVQATWYDARGKKQSLQHRDYKAANEANKWEKMVHFGEQAPKIRAQVKKDLRGKDAERDRVAAAVVSLIDQVGMRVGTESNVDLNETYGASSLRKEHVTAAKDGLRVNFLGKHHKEWDRTIGDPAVVAAAKHMLTLPGERLWQYRDPKGELKPFTERTLTAYLKTWDVTAKQFRSYHGTHIVYDALKTAPAPKNENEARANVIGAVKQAAEFLGNSPSVCEASYVNPEIIESYMKGLLP